MILGGIQDHPAVDLEEENSNPNSTIKEEKTHTKKETINIKGKIQKRKEENKFSVL
jgi:hypothetical protein